MRRACATAESEQHDLAFTTEMTQEDEPMNTPIESRRREISRLKRQISYYCGVIARSASRERMKDAWAAIRERERRLREEAALASARRSGDG